MSDERKVRAAGKSAGKHSLRALMGMRKRGELAEPVEFWSKRKQAWMPIAGIMEDFEYNTADRLAELRGADSTGIKSVRVLDSGNGDDCPACMALTGKSFSLAEAPALPPPGCSCVPWCRCVLIASP